MNGSLTRLALLGPLMAGFALAWYVAPTPAPGQETVALTPA